jgi:anti-anti-sigma regulatory factor
VVRLPDTPSSSGGAASCEVSELGTCVQVTVAGALDTAAIAQLRAAERRVSLSPGRVVVLDLCDATLVDPAALVEFALGLRARASSHGCSFVVVARPHVREVFADAGAGVITIVADAAEPR